MREESLLVKAGQSSGEAELWSKIPSCDWTSWETSLPAIVYHTIRLMWTGGHHENLGTNFELEAPTFWSHFYAGSRSAGLSQPFCQLVGILNKPHFHNLLPVLVRASPISIFKSKVTFAWSEKASCRHQQKMDARGGPFQAALHKGSSVCLISPFVPGLFHSESACVSTYTLATTLKVIIARMICIPRPRSSRVEFIFGG